MFRCPNLRKGRSDRSCHRRHSSPIVGSNSAGSMCTFWRRIISPPGVIRIARIGYKEDTDAEYDFQIRLTFPQQSSIAPYSYDLRLLGADDDFTACYGLSVDDRKRMLAVIRSAPKRQLASAAKVSTRTIPATLAAANEMSDAKLRRLFEAAASLVDEKQKAHSSDEETNGVAYSASKRAPSEAAGRKCLATMPRTSRCRGSNDARNKFQHA
jgi:hypothetical protein